MLGSGLLGEHISRSPLRSDSRAASLLNPVMKLSCTNKLAEHVARMRKRFGACLELPCQRNAWLQQLVSTSAVFGKPSGEKWTEGIHAQGQPRNKIKLAASVCTQAVCQTESVLICVNLGFCAACCQKPSSGPVLPGHVCECWRDAAKQATH